jgi:nickel transport protein
MPGAIMKSMVHLGARLGLVGSAMIGSSLIGSMQVLALPQEQILQKLGPVPVFTITDNKGAPLVASQPNRQNQGSLAGVFINQKDAQAFVAQLKTKNPNLAKSVRVVPVSLGEVYKLDQSNQNKPNSLDIAYVPSKQQVDAALALLRQNGQKVNSFSGTPLFVAKAGKKEGYLTIKQANQQVIPFFFNKEELQTMLERFKKQQPSLASTVKIQVVNLEGVLKTLQTGKDQELNQIMLIPPRESIEFVRSLQPAPAQNQNRPAATPSKKP